MARTFGDRDARAMLSHMAQVWLPAGRHDRARAEATHSPAAATNSAQGRGQSVAASLPPKAEVHLRSCDVAEVPLAEIRTACSPSTMNAKIAIHVEASMPAIPPAEQTS